MSRVSLAILKMTAKWWWAPLFSGALVVLLAGQAVVQHQKIVFLAALGIAEVCNAETVTNKTVFSIASATKAFTGVALMQLVENGKLELAALLHVKQRV